MPTSPLDSFSGEYVNLLEFPTTTEAHAGSFLHINQGGIDMKIAVVDFMTKLNGGNPFNMTIRQESGTSLILTLADVNAYLSCTNNSTVNVELRNAGTVGWKVGDSIIVAREGNGSINITTGSGVTILPAASGLGLEKGQAGQLLCLDNTPSATVFKFITGGNAGATGQVVSAEDLPTIGIIYRKYFITELLREATYYNGEYWGPEGFYIVGDTTKRNLVSSSGAGVGYKFYNTDTNTAQRWTGSAWVNV